MQKDLFPEITRRMAGYPLLREAKALGDLMIPVCLVTLGGMCRLYLTGLDPRDMYAN